MVYVHMNSAKHVNIQNGMQRLVSDLDEFVPTVLRYCEKLVSPAHIPYKHDPSRTLASVRAIPSRVDRQDRLL